MFEHAAQAKKAFKDLRDKGKSAKEAMREMKESKQWYKHAQSAVFDRKRCGQCLRVGDDGRSAINIGKGIVALTNEFTAGQTFPFSVCLQVDHSFWESEHTMNAWACCPMAEVRPARGHVAEFTRPMLPS